MDITTRKESEQLQKTTIPTVPKTEERKWYFFDVLLDRQEKEKILQYFLKHNLNKINLKDDKLVIEDNSHQLKTVSVNDAETRQIKSYLQSRAKQTLLKKDLISFLYHKNTIKI